MKNNRSLLIAGMVVLGLVTIMYFAFRSTPQQYSPTSPKEPERGGPKTVLLQNTTRLSQILLAEQFLTVKQQLQVYILTKVSTGANTAKVSDVKVAPDGSVNFTVAVENSKTFAVKVDRSKFDRITFTVPQDNYQTTAKVYGAGD